MIEWKAIALGFVLGAVAGYLGLQMQAKGGLAGLRAGMTRK